MWKARLAAVCVWTMITLLLCCVVVNGDPIMTRVSGTGVQRVCVSMSCACMRDVFAV